MSSHTRPPSSPKQATTNTTFEGVGHIASLYTPTLLRMRIVIIAHGGRSRAPRISHAQTYHSSSTGICRHASSPKCYNGCWECRPRVNSTVTCSRKHEEYITSVCRQLFHRQKPTITWLTCRHAPRHIHCFSRELPTYHLQTYNSPAAIAYHCLRHCHRMPAYDTEFAWLVCSLSDERALSLPYYYYIRDMMKRGYE